MKAITLGRIGKSLLAVGFFWGMTVTCLFGQGAPASAKSAFQTASGNAAATWNAGPNGTWEATWLKEGQRMVYCYDQAGQLQQKKIIGSFTAFPANVQAGIKAAYPQGEIQYAYKVVDRTNQKYFEVQVLNVGGVDRMRYSLEGKPLGRTSMTAVQPAGSSPTASAKPVVSEPTPVAKPVNTPPVAMRGEAATSKPAPVLNDSELEEDMDDLVDDEDMGDLIEEEDENWDDIDVLGEEEEDIDLLEGSEDLDDGMDIEEEDDDDDDL